jgi:hypothetical protein
MFAKVKVQKRLISPFFTPISAGAARPTSTPRRPPTHPLPSPSHPCQSPPGAPPGHPRVIPIFHPSNRRHPIQPRQRRPPAAQLPQHSVDPRRALKLRSPRLHRPGRPRNFFVTESHSFDQPLFLVRSNVHSLPDVLSIDPPSQSRAELALPVIHQGHPAIRHPSKLH